MVTKLIIKIVIMLVIVTGMSNYVMYIMTGKTPFSSIDFSLPNFSFSSLKSEVGEITGDIGATVPGVPSDNQTVYKWVDANGVTQYTSEPPPAGQEFTSLNLDPNTNIVQGLKPKTPEAAPEKPAADMPQAPMMPSNAKQLIEDAKNVQNLLNERFEKQEEALKNI